MYVYTQCCHTVIHVSCMHSVNYVCIAPHGGTLHVDCRVQKKMECWVVYLVQYQAYQACVLLHYECTVINGCWGLSRKKYMVLVS